MGPINALAYATFDNFKKNHTYTDVSADSSNDIGYKTSLAYGADKGATGTLMFHFPAQATNPQTYDIVIRSHDVCKYPLNTPLSQLHRPSAATDTGAWNAMAGAYNYVAEHGVTAAQGAAVAAVFA
jgi:hypothetical protein